MLIGIAPLTMVRTNAGRSEYVYQGAPAPADITDADAARLLDEGFLVEVADDVVPVDVVVADDPATGAAGPGVTLERPKNMAVKDEWVRYRIGQDLLTEDLAEEVTKPQLQDDAFMATFLEQASAHAEAAAAAEREAEAQRQAEAARQAAEATSAQQPAQPGA